MFQLQEVCWINVVAHKIENVSGGIYVTIVILNDMIQIQMYKEWLIRIHPPQNLHISKQHDPIIKERLFCSDPIKHHVSPFGKCIGSNARRVPNKRTVSCNWNTRVSLPLSLSLKTVSSHWNCNSFQGDPSVSRTGQPPSWSIRSVKGDNPTSSSLLCQGKYESIDEINCRFFL